MSESWEAPLPSLDAVRRHVGYLMDRRGLSHGRLAALIRQANPELTLHQSTITRFLQGSDLSYGHVFQLWNVLLDAQSLETNARITEAMVPAQRILWASPEMTREEFMDRFVRHDIDYAPYRVRQRVMGILNVRKLHAHVRQWNPNALLSEVLGVYTDALHVGKPHVYRASETVAAVERHMTDAIEREPTRALAFVKRGKTLLGLVTPYNFIGIQKTP